MHVAEFFLNRLIEVSHQRSLRQFTQVPLHELSKLSAERRDCLPMAAHIGKRDPRHDAARAQRYVVDVATVSSGPTGTECTHTTKPGTSSRVADRSFPAATSAHAMRLASDSIGLSLFFRVCSLPSGSQIMVLALIEACARKRIYWTMVLETPRFSATTGACGD
jgi:hypothetical protein